MLYDLYDEPEMVHDVMRFFTEGVKSMLRQYEEQNLISLNNDGQLHYTGGVGYNDQLPQPGFDPNRVRLCDVWGAAEAQEFAQVSPEMHEEFVLQYERELLEPFGLNGYGCCDDLSAKLDNVLKIKNLRRVAVCPWADIAKFTPVLQKNYIMTWKPKPMPLAYEAFDPDIVRKELEEGITKANGSYDSSNSGNNEFCRQNDIYVFCLNTGDTRDTSYPLNLNNWEFYIIPTAVINEKCGNNKTISLGKIKKLGFAAKKYDEIKTEIDKFIDAM